MKDSTRKPLVLHHPYPFNEISFRGYERAAGVYLILNRRNGKIYIGSAVNFTDRWTAHRTRLRYGNHPCTPLQQDFTENCGEDFSISILEKCLPEFTADREQYWLNKYQAADPAKGYNIAAVAKNKASLKKNRVQKKLPNGVTIDVRLR